MRPLHGPVPVPARRGGGALRPLHGDQLSLALSTVDIINPRTVQADHWGFGDPEGCMECGCSEASEYSQCDLETGQCVCKHGVTGPKCNRCLNGFW